MWREASPRTDRFSSWEKTKHLVHFKNSQFSDDPVPKFVLNSPVEGWHQHYIISLHEGKIIMTMILCVASWMQRNTPFFYEPK